MSQAPRQPVIEFRVGSCTVALRAAEDHSLFVTIGGLLSLTTVPHGPLASFCAADNAPIFYGATVDGRMVTLMCDLLSHEVHERVYSFASIRVHQVVCASSEATVLILGKDGGLWLVNMATPLNVQKIGVVAGSDRVVASFASPHLVAVCCRAAEGTDELRVKLASLTTGDQATWGMPHPAGQCGAPTWAACCTSALSYSAVAVHVAGSKVVQAQLEGELVGPVRVKKRTLMTARRVPVIGIRTTKDALRLQMQDGRLIELTAKGMVTRRGRAASTGSELPPNVLRGLPGGQATARSNK